jgi:uncharacterized protein (TIGR03000 family)
MTSKDGKEHSHLLSADAIFTLDGDVCKFEDLKAGMDIRLTTDDKNVATKVDARRESLDASNRASKGTLVRVADNELIMTDKDGKEHSCRLAADASFTLDGEVCKAEDLKSGMGIIVTTRKDDKKVAIKVAALRNKKEADLETSLDPDRNPKNRATVTVNLPDGARLTFNNDPTVSIGANRHFITPPLKPGMDFHYTVKATLIREGRTQTATKRIKVRAGEETQVDLVLTNGTKGGESTSARDVDELTMHDGKVVKIVSDKLVMTSKDGKEHNYTFADAIKVTCDGKACNPEELKPGMTIRVTTKNGDKGVATRIEALDKREEFTSLHDGKVVSVADGKLVMTCTDGMAFTHTLAKDANLTCDGKVCQASDLKPGMRIRVTTTDDALIATRIEALVKNDQFQVRN